MIENNCLWHKNDDAIGETETVGCPQCGRMIATKECDNCHEEFIDWDYKLEDDIIAPPGVTESGDFMCQRCAWRHNEDEERMFSEEQDYFLDPYETGI